MTDNSHVTIPAIGGSFEQHCIVTPRSSPSQIRFLLALLLGERKTALKFGEEKAYFWPLRLKLLPAKKLERVQGMHNLVIIRI
jgi:hypothetical protein